MKNGLFYLTYNGYYNYTTGIGTQTKLFLNGIDCYYEKLKKSFGDFEINMVVPKYDYSVDNYNIHHVIYANNIINKYGGEVYMCDSAMEKGKDGFWTVSNWERLTPSAASFIYNKSKKYKRNLVFAVDPPFLHVPMHIELYNKNNKFDIKSVIINYSSSYIHNKKNISFKKLGWEYQGFASARLYKNIFIGSFCNYMTNHFIKYYGADNKSFIPYSSSLLFNDEEYSELEQSKVNSILEKYHIPKDKDIVFAFGRAAWIKGFDILSDSLVYLMHDIHLVLIAVPFEIDPSEYEIIIQKSDLSYTLITEFKRDLPHALCQHDHCRIVVCPSRGEPLSNIPLEVALWSKNKGPVVLASNIDGFLEQISDGENGFLFEEGDSKSLACKMNMILQKTKRELDIIRKKAYEKVINERSFERNFATLLKHIWGLTI